MGFKEPPLARQALRVFLAIAGLAPPSDEAGRGKRLMGFKMPPYSGYQEHGLLRTPPLPAIVAWQALRQMGASAHETAHVLAAMGREERPTMGRADFQVQPKEWQRWFICSGGLVVDQSPICAACNGTRRVHLTSYLFITQEHGDEWFRPCQLCRHEND